MGTLDNLYRNLPPVFVGTTEKHVETTHNLNIRDFIEAIINGIELEDGLYVINVNDSKTSTKKTIRQTPEHLKEIIEKQLVPSFEESVDCFKNACQKYDVKKPLFPIQHPYETDILSNFRTFVDFLRLLEKAPNPSPKLVNMRKENETFLKDMFCSDRGPESEGFLFSIALAFNFKMDFLPFLIEHKIIPEGFLNNSQRLKLLTLDSGTYGLAYDKKEAHLTILPPNSESSDEYNITLEPFLNKSEIDSLLLLHKKGYINQQFLAELVPAEMLLEKYATTKHKSQKEQSIKKIDYLKALPDAKLLSFYLEGSVPPKELGECHFSSTKLFTIIENSEISQNNLLRLANDANFSAFFPSSDKLNELYDACALGGKTMLELVNLGKVNPEAIPNLYKKEKVLRNAIIVPEAFEEEYLTTDDDFRQLFSIDFMLRLENQGKFTPKLVEFYKSTIVPPYEDKKEEFYSKRREILKKLELTNDNIPTLLSLAEKGILSIDDISALDIKESDLTLAGLSCEKLCILYSAGKIDGINLLGMSPTELITCWKKGALTENASDDFLVPTDFANAYSEGNIDCKDMLHLFNAGKIDIENLDCLEQSKLQETILQMVILSNDKEKGAPIEDRFISPEKIAELFLNKRIDYDTFMELRSNGKISEEFFTETVEAYDIESEMEKIRELSEIENTAVPYGSFLSQHTVHSLEPASATRKVSIDPELRNDFIKALNYERYALISKGALEGYMFFAIPSQKVAVLEKLYNEKSKTGSLTPALDNATYVLPIIKALELARSSNKTDLRNEKNVYRVNHTQGWANNLLKKIRKVNPKFEYKRYQKEYSDLIALISENYNENRGE